MDLGAYLDAARAFDEDFRARWEPVGPAPASEVDAGRLAAAWAEYTGACRTTTRSSIPATPARCSSRPTRWRWPATWPR